MRTSGAGQTTSRNMERTSRDGKTDHSAADEPGREKLARPSARPADVGEGSSRRPRRPGRPTSTSRWNARPSGRSHHEQARRFDDRLALRGAWRVGRGQREDSQEDSGHRDRAPDEEARPLDDGSCSADGYQPQPDSPHPRRRRRGHHAQDALPVGGGARDAAAGRLRPSRLGTGTRAQLEGAPMREHRTESGRRDLLDPVRSPAALGWTKYRIDRSPDHGPTRASDREREKGFEPSTSTLARWHSTTELLPRAHLDGEGRPSSAHDPACQRAANALSVPSPGRPGALPSRGSPRAACYRSSGVRTDADARHDGEPALVGA